MNNTQHFAAGQGPLHRLEPSLNSALQRVLSNHAGGWPVRGGIDHIERSANSQQQEAWRRHSRRSPGSLLQGAAVELTRVMGRIAFLYRPRKIPERPGGHASEGDVSCWGSWVEGK